MPRLDMRTLFTYFKDLETQWQLARMTLPFREVERFPLFYRDKDTPACVDEPVY